MINKTEEKVFQHNKDVKGNLISISMVGIDEGEADPSLVDNFKFTPEKSMREKLTILPHHSKRH